ncbi:hypothetical protein [Inquilinus sp. CA228]|uniref:hypothetical protein n=1 Tax=Inquilinus sp. CA228 TaxID=3455609 RepID=UPI003F8D4C6B
MTDNSGQPPIGEGSQGQAPAPTAQDEALNRWLVAVLGIGTAPDQLTRGTVQTRRGLVRRDTDEELKQAQRDMGFVSTNQSMRQTEHQALVAELTQLERTQKEQFAQLASLTAEDSQLAGQLASQNQDAAARTRQHDQLSADKGRYDAEIMRLHDEYAQVWESVRTELDGQGIALGEVGGRREPGELKALIVERRTALTERSAELTREMDAATAKQTTAETEKAGATEKAADLQREIDALEHPSVDAEASEEVMAARLAAFEALRVRLENERSEEAAKIAASEATLAELTAELEELEAEKQKATDTIGVLAGLVDGENPKTKELQSLMDEYNSNNKKSFDSFTEMQKIEQENIEGDHSIQEIQRNIQEIANNITETNIAMENVKAKTAKQKKSEGDLGLELLGLEQRRTEVDENIDRLVKIAEDLDSQALLDAINALPATPPPGSPTDATAATTTQPQEPGVEQTEPSHGIEPVAPGGEASLPDPAALRQAAEVIEREIERLGVTEEDEAASASLSSATLSALKIMATEVPALVGLMSVREAMSYGVADASETARERVAMAMIALNFLPVAVKGGTVLYDSSSSRPPEDRMVPTRKQVLSLFANALMMIGATVLAVKYGGGLAALAPNTLRPLIIGFRPLITMMRKLSENRRGDLPPNWTAVGTDDLFYSIYSQMTTVMLAFEAAHTGAGAQAAGLTGKEAVGEVGKYIALFTAVEALESYTSRACNQFFDRIESGLEPAMPGDPNARQGLQGVLRYRARVDFQVRQTFKAIRLRGTDVAHALQAFTYINLMMGNVVGGLTKDFGFREQLVTAAFASFLVTLITYLPYVGLSDYRPRARPATATA